MTSSPYQETRTNPKQDGAPLSIVEIQPAFLNPSPAAAAHVVGDNVAPQDSSKERRKVLNDIELKPSSSKGRSKVARTENRYVEPKGHAHFRHPEPPNGDASFNTREGHSFKLSNGLGGQELPPSQMDAYEKAKLEELEVAVKYVPDESKAAFQRAMDTDPMLVAKDANPVRFLRCEGYKVKPATCRLLAHWEMRSNLFGARRLYHMSQTGEGTLQRNDISLLASGVLLPLPYDKRGRSVLLFDVSKADDASLESLKRVAFYVLSVASEVKESQLHGMVLLLPIESIDGTSSSSFKMVDILDTMSARITDVFVLGCSPEPLSPALKDRFANRVQVLVGDVKNLHFVIEKHRTDVLARLSRHGLVRWNLPKMMGGEYGVESFVLWQELRTRLEWDLPPAASHRGIDLIFDFSNVKLPAQLSEPERVERSRRMNVLHSRRKRERERIEIEVLHEQCDEFRERNADLRKDSARLEQLIDAAEYEARRAGSYGFTNALPMYQQPSPHRVALYTAPPVVSISAESVAPVAATDSVAPGGHQHQPSTRLFHPMEARAYEAAGSSLHHYDERPMGSTRKEEVVHRLFGAAPEEVLPNRPPRDAAHRVPPPLQYPRQPHAFGDPVIRQQIALREYHHHQRLVLEQQHRFQEQQLRDYYQPMQSPLVSQPLLMQMMGLPPPSQPALGLGLRSAAPEPLLVAATSIASHGGYAPPLARPGR